MSTTSGGLPLMAQTQNSRYLTYNELAWALNVLQTGVLDRDLTSPPGSPSEGDAYIVDSPATGSWAGHENEIAFFFGGVWNFLEPELAQGNGLYVVDEGIRIRWSTGSPIGYEEISGTGGDASTNTATSVDGEVALFSGTGGKTLKRATGTGFVRLASGVQSAVDGANDDIAQRKAGVWTNRTLAQVSADLQGSGLTVDMVGFRGIPQNSQSAAYTTVAADAGKHIHHPSTDANARTFTIDSNANVAYPIGTAITFTNRTSQVVTIAITSDTMYLAGTTTTGSRSLAENGIATALKVNSTTWIISGSGLT